MEIQEGGSCFILGQGLHSQAIAEEGDNMWIGTNSGLVKINKITEETTFYHTWNSSLPDNQIKALAIDKSGNIWIGTNEDGLVKFDGSNWTIYNSSNSGIPNNSIRSITFDQDDNLWVGTFLGGMAVRTGTIWTAYDVPFPS